MGIIEKQTIKGSFFSYLGVAFGFVAVGLLWPRFLEPEEIGVINFLIAVSAILAHIASLGFNSICVRLFPYFRNDKTRHNGFLSLALLFASAGTLFIIAYFFFFKERIVQNNVEKSFLVANYVYFIIPFTIATLLFNLFDSLHKVMYNAVIGVFVKDFLFRLLKFLSPFVFGFLYFFIFLR